MLLSLIPVLGFHILLYFFVQVGQPGPSGNTGTVRNTGTVTLNSVQMMTGWYVSKSSMILELVIDL
ncbi:hypothetical protein EA58_01185 [Photobacterium galatheae]|uniref:Uncharacterized protein n=2 Tax=Photobacterium galatheae TaxID=1654360 RepID=A0A066S1I4_9GAMM|nr:hypothetical protein EA58_01185 [Photobacterium galatheae]